MGKERRDDERNAECERKEVNGEKGPGREVWRKKKKKKAERAEKGKGVGGWSVSVSHAVSQTD